MSLVFSAFTPHPPLLLDAISGETSDLLPKTRKSFEHLRDELYLAQPETIIIISPHGESYKDSFGVCAHPLLHTNLRPFGDAITRDSFSTDLELTSHLFEACKKEKIACSAIPLPDLDYGAAIPLLMLGSALPHVKVIVVHPMQGTPKNAMDFGYALKGVILQTNKRVALIASGDLSHRLETESPGGFHKDAHSFEKKIQEIIMNGNSMGLLSLDQKTVNEVATCSYEPLLILFGVLGRMKTNPEILSYEAPQGIGFLTVYFPIF